VASVLKDSQLSRLGRGVEFSRLNEAECCVLRLLAEGHTAKSVANELGCTPAAVNERLREARRKTGVGSSRELARLLVAQENRHEQIGVGLRPASVLPSPSDAELWRPQTGVFVMLALLLIVATGAATLMSQPTSTNEFDPLVGAPLERFSQPADLHSKIRAEKRDSFWADRTEAAIRSRVLQIPVIGKDGNALRVTCGATLCEIAGTLIGPDRPIKEYDPNLPINRAQADLQDKPLNDDLGKLGLKNEGGSFMSGRGKPDRGVFLLYYSRIEGNSK
jgi:DNA-binding CsgD family transcriptional regulator